MTFLTHNNTEKQIATTRVAFFILGFRENSLELRKRLLELLNAKLSKKLVTNGIKFTM
ncbi:MAG: hypothetical protein V7K90_16900 [Nostoc sp.]|uniref:hypothetical protein n=1 Tax=Nostoc sp. TaxID=1180 RepID=UPI002FF7475A